jgi:hypothetical protein
LTIALAAIAADLRFPLVDIDANMFHRWPPCADVCAGGQPPLHPIYSHNFLFGFLDKTRPAL